MDLSETSRHAIRAKLLTNLFKRGHLYLYVQLEGLSI